ncbi:MAG: hypothetical protein LBM09_00090 [Candidatus Nomurabacteria bacterium]|nr:hypothetical protein [Candidatus Nomurabacteria bacterium]
MRRRKVFVPAKPNRSCGKNRYNSEREADIVAREQELIFANQNLHLHSYFCAFCGGWHLTNRQD